MVTFKQVGYHHVGHGYKIINIKIIKTKTFIIIKCTSDLQVSNRTRRVWAIESTDLTPDYINHALDFQFFIGKAFLC